LDNKPITDVRVGKHRIYTQAIGDTWDPAWSNDNKLYFGGNDGSGWNKTCSNNLFFNTASGEDPLDLTGETVNCLADYDGWAKAGPDGCTWKSGGTLSLDGVLYYSIARHMYGTKSGDPYKRQLASRASIIKSEDRGRTFTRPAKENYLKPMFPDGRLQHPISSITGRMGTPMMWMVLTSTFTLYPTMAFGATAITISWAGPGKTRSGTLTPRTGNSSPAVTVVRRRAGRKTCTRQH
jgi:hypothetical protein